MDDLKKKIKKSLKEKTEKFQETDLGKKLDKQMEKVSGKLSEKLSEKLENDETLQKIAMGILKRAQKVQGLLDETGDIVEGGKEIVKRTGKKVLENIEKKMTPDEGSKNSGENSSGEK